MVKEIQGLSWKPVQFEGDVLNSRDFDGLIGLEECVNYDLNSVVTNKKVCIKQPFFN